MPVNLMVCVLVLPFESGLEVGLVTWDASCISEVSCYGVVYAMSGGDELGVVRRVSGLFPSCCICVSVLIGVFFGGVSTLGYDLMVVVGGWVWLVGLMF
jgi:hypothetical protein